jgi:hypothetical protein
MLTLPDHPIRHPPHYPAEAWMARRSGDQWLACGPMTLLFVVLALVMVGWPLLALVAVVLAGLGIAALGGDQVEADGDELPGWWRVLTGRAVWRLMSGALVAASAAYGYGLSRTTFLVLTDADDRCSIVGSTGDWQPATQTWWPLRDTTCGADLVPGFVNPAVGVAALSFAGLAVLLLIRRRAVASLR